MKRITKKVEYEVDQWSPFCKQWVAMGTEDNMKAAKQIVRAIIEQDSPEYHKARIVRVEITEKRTICR